MPCLSSALHFQFPLQPHSQHRIGNHRPAFLDFDKLLFDQGPFYDTDIGRRTELVFLQDLLRGKFAVNSIQNGPQEIHLIGRKTLGLLLEQRRILVENILTSRLEILLCGNFVRMNPYQPSQLLYIRGVIVHRLADLFGQLFRDLFARRLKALANVADPVLRPNFRQIDGIAELIEREALFSRKVRSSNASCCRTDSKKPTFAAAKSNAVASGMFWNP